VKGLGITHQECSRILFLEACPQDVHSHYVVKGSCCQLHLKNTELKTNRFLFCSFGAFKLLLCAVNLQEGPVFANIPNLTITEMFFLAHLIRLALYGKFMKAMAYSDMIPPEHTFSMTCSLTT
jgi:hypothetical protein